MRLAFATTVFLLIVASGCAHPCAARLTPHDIAQFRDKWDDQMDSAPIAEAQWINTAGKTLSDKDLAIISRMRKLEALVIRQDQGTSLNPDAIGCLAGLDSLVTLAIDQSDLSRADFSFLRKLHRLENLGVSENPPHSFFKAVADLKHITALGIDHNRQLDLRDIQHVSENQHIRVLSANVTNLSNKGLRHISSIRGLEVLHIAETQVTDEGVKHLATLQHLTTLTLFTTRVSDEGLMALAKLPRLERIDVRNTQVTAEGVRRFRLLSPDVTLQWGSDPQ